MTTFIKAKLKKSEFRVAENKTEYNIITKLIFLRIIIPKIMMMKAIISRNI